MLRDDKLYKSFHVLSNFILKICLDTTRKRVLYSEDTLSSVMHFYLRLKHVIVQTSFYLFRKNGEGIISNKKLFKIRSITSYIT